MGKIPQTERDVNILRDFASGLSVTDIAKRNAVTNPVVYNITKYARKAFWDKQSESLQNKILQMWSDNCDSEMIADAVNRSVPMVVGFLVYAGKTPNDPGWKTASCLKVKTKTTVVSLKDDALLIDLIASGMYPDLAAALQTLIAFGNDTVGKCRKVLPDLRKFPKFYKIRVEDVFKLEEILHVNDKQDIADTVTGLRDRDDYALNTTANTAKAWLSKQEGILDADKDAMKTAKILNDFKPRTTIRSESVLLSQISDWVIANWLNLDMRDTMSFILRTYSVSESLAAYARMCQTGNTITLGDVKRAGKSCIVLTSTDGYLLK